MLKLSLGAIAPTGTVPVITNTHELIVHRVHATALVAAVVAQWEDQLLAHRP